MFKRQPTRTALLFGVSVIYFTAFIISLGVSAVDHTNVETVIPKDAIVYLKLQNLQDCREAVKSSENWKEATELITGLPQWASTHQLIQMMPVFLGTDLQTLSNTFLGDEIAVMVSPGDGGFMIGIVIKNSGKHQEAENIFARLVNSTHGVDGNKVYLTQETYQGVEYRTMHANDGTFSYGSLNKDLFLIGIMPGSFEKMVDVYQTDNTAITENTAYRSAIEQFGKSEVFAFVNVDVATPFIKMMFPPAIGNELASVQTLVYSCDLLQQGGSQRIYAQLKEDHSGAFISRLKEKSEIRSTQGLSGKEGFSLAMAPSSAQAIWKMLLLSKLEAAPHTDNSFLGFLVPNQTDILSTLTGDIALSVGTSTFYTLNQNSPNLRSEVVDGVVKSIALEFQEVDLGFIFNPDSPAKWQTFFHHIVEKLTIDPKGQFDYKGITFNTATIPGKLYYGTVDDLFVLALSEKQFQSIVDNVLASEENKRPSQEIAEAHPAGLIQFNLHEFLSFVDSTSEVAWLSKDALTLRKKIENLLVSITAREDAMWLEVQLSDDEKPIETVALLAPLVFMRVTKDTIPTR